MLQNATATTPLLESAGDSKRRGGGCSRWWSKVLDVEEAKNQVLFSLPMIVTSVSYYAIPLVSVMFSGHLGHLELAGATLANSWAFITGFAFMVTILIYVRIKAVCCKIPTALHFGIAYALVHWTSLGFKGAPLAASVSLWISMLLLAVYVICSKRFEPTWQGFYSESFSYIFTNLKLALPSAAMLCLEDWATEILVLLAGLMPNSELTTSLIAMCVNTQAFAFMITYGLSAAASTRVSNEFGAGNIDRAKSAMAVTLKLTIVLALIVVLTLAFGHNIWAGFFSDSREIIKEFASLTPFLAISIAFDSVQGVLSGHSFSDCGLWKEIHASPVDADFEFGAWLRASNPPGSYKSSGGRHFGDREGSPSRNVRSFSPPHPTARPFRSDGPWRSHSGKMVGQRRVVQDNHKVVSGLDSSSKKEGILGGGPTYMENTCLVGTDALQEDRTVENSGGSVPNSVGCGKVGGMSGEDGGALQDQSLNIGRIGSLGELRQDNGGGSGQPGFVGTALNGCVNLHSVDGMGAPSRHGIEVCSGGEISSGRWKRRAREKGAGTTDRVVENQGGGKRDGGSLEVGFLPVEKKQKNIHAFDNLSIEISASREGSPACRTK
ncbi:hypothetical protein LWI29_018036 [Acer saccharum]|uniref:Protein DETOXIFICATION n=1 Tax=Acer saccharum TaxID=4024 RepID=A0AA39W3P6_ACESA|nr:hypothetical protein LWI29_018036 [Acer saccharum]